MGKLVIVLQQAQTSQVEVMSFEMPKPDSASGSEISHQSSLQKAVGRLRRDNVNHHGAQNLKVDSLLRH